MARGVGRKNRTTGTFGSVDRLATGYRARYYGPDGRRYKAPTLFSTKQDARGWLALRQAEIIKREWMPAGAEKPKPKRLTLAGYAETWMAHRDLKDRTREHYRKLLDQHILPALGALPLASITADDIRAWHAKTATGTPTLRAHCYGLLRTIMAAAVADGKVPANPCVIRGAGSAKRAITIRPASLPELEKITTAMPEPYQGMILLASWCAMRYGELAELRRKDVDLDDAVVRIRRAVVRTAGGFQVTSPKTTAGVRDVNVPPHLLPALRDHMAKHVAPGDDSLLFPAAHGGHLAPGTLYRRFYAARDAAGRPDLRFHDLRHSGAVLAALSGATLVELMNRLGHSTPAASLRYQHLAEGRDKEIAARLSALAEGASR